MTLRDWKLQVDINEKLVFLPEIITSDQVRFEVVANLAEVVFNVELSEVSQQTT